MKWNGRASKMLRLLRDGFAVPRACFQKGSACLQLQVCMESERQSAVSPTQAQISMHIVTLTKCRVHAGGMGAHTCTLSGTM